MNRKMTAIHVVHVMGKMNRGGAESLVMNLYRNIDKQRIIFDFVVHTDEICAFDNEIKSTGGRIFHAPKYNGRNHYQYISWWKNFYKEHEEIKIVHGHIRSTAIIYLNIAKKYGLKTIIHSHSTSNGVGVIARIKDLMQKPIPRIADYRFACSKIAGEWLFGKYDFILFKNAIDLKEYQYNECIREKYRDKLQFFDNIVYGHVGRFHESKNHIFLLNTFAKIHSINQNTILLLIGDGPLREEIKKEIQILHVEDAVKLVGVREDVPNLLQAIDVFLFPSKWEGFPVSVIEAQAAGLPCFVSNNITQEVKVSELVTYLSIESGSDIWSKCVLNSSLLRMDVLNELRKSGFDVKTSVNWLMKFYEDIVTSNL